jgi:excisionase family DNA binding protein
MTPDDIITKKDLETFKEDLFALLGKPARDQFAWLKAVDVRKLLGVSNGTLLNLRVKGELPFSKIGGLYFYKREDIEQMLERGQKKSPKVSKR